MTLFTAVVPLLIGLVLGLIGGGGSVLTVPALVYIFGLGTKSAIAISLLVVASGAIIAVVNHDNRTDISFKTIMPFGLAGMFGAYLAAQFIAPRLNDSFQLILFALMVIVISIFMLFRNFKNEIASLNQDNDARYLVSSLIGLLLGAVTGIVGVGGGFLIVPALILFLRLRLHSAIASSFVIIAMQSVTGFIGYMNFVDVDLGFTTIFSMVFVMGSLIGAKFSAKIPSQVLSKVFAIVLLLIGVFIVLAKSYENFISLL